MMLQICSEARVLSSRAFSTFRIFPAQGKDRLEAAVAPLLRGAARGVAFHQVELALLGVALLALGELAGQARSVEGSLAPREVAGLAGRLAGPGGFQDLEHDPLGVGRMLLEILRQLLVDQALDDPLDLGVAELALGLPLELGVRDLDADDRAEALAGVVALERLGLVLHHARRVREGVQGAGERALEADQVGAAVVGVDVVGEGVGVLGVAVVPLERDLDLHPVPRPLDEDGLLVERLLVAVQVLDEGGDPAQVLEGVLLAVALVLEGDEDPAVQERELAQALREGVEAEGGGLEDLAVRLEGDLGAAAVGDPGVLDGTHGNAARDRTGGRPSCRARSRPRGSR